MTPRVFPRANDFLKESGETTQNRNFGIPKGSFHKLCVSTDSVAYNKRQCDRKTEMAIEQDSDLQVNLCIPAFL